MSEIHGGVGAYVVNAMNPVEVEEFEAHLEVCPTCSREVVEFCETAAELSLLATLSAPPPQLRSSVLASISGVRVLPPADREETDLSTDHIVTPLPRRAAVGSAESHSFADSSSESGQSPATAPTPTDELAVRRSRRRSRLLTLAVAAVMVVALSLGGWVFSLVNSQQAQVADQALQTQLLSAPDVKIASSELRSGAKVSFISSKSLNKALFVGDQLPAIGPDQAFQMWTLQGKTATPDQLVAGGASRRQWFNGDISGSTGLAITIEPKSGSQTPTMPLQASTRL